MLKVEYLISSILFLISAIFHVSSFSNRTNPSHLFYINNSFANTDSFFSAMIFEKKKKKTFKLSLLHFLQSFGKTIIANVIEFGFRINN